LLPGKRGTVVNRTPYTTVAAIARIGLEFLPFGFAVLAIKNYQAQKND